MGFPAVLSQFITLPFDADISKYFADPDEIENMEGIIIAYHEEE